MELYKLYPLEQLPNFFEKELARLESSLDLNLSFQNKKYIRDLSQEFKNDFKIFLQNILDKEEVIVSEGWINYIKYDKVMNGLDWHNEVGLGANKDTIVEDPYMGIIWIDGDSNCGGEFKFIHDITNEIVLVPFNPPNLMIMTKETIHAINHYSSSKHRISLNFNFR